MSVINGITSIEILKTVFFKGDHRIFNKNLRTDYYQSVLLYTDLEYSDGVKPVFSLNSLEK